MPDIDPQSDDLTINSLVTKIVVMVFVGSFASALLVSWAAIHPTRDFLTQSIAERYPKGAQRAADETAAWLSAGRDEFAQLLADSGDSELSAPTADSGDSELSALLARSHYLEGVALCDRHSATASARAGIAPPCPGASDASLAAADWISIRDANGARIPAVAASPAGGRDADLVAIGAFDRQRLADLLSEHRPHPEGVMLLAAETGDVLAAAGGAEIPSQIEIPAAGAARDARVREKTGSPWRQIMSSLHPVAESSWYVAFEIPFGIAYAPLLSLIRRMLLIDLAVVLALSVIAYRITSAVLKPIESLSVGARRVADGNFDLEIPDPGTRDEIGVLIGAFNHMLRRVRGYQDEIQQSYENLRAHNIKLQQANELLEQLSITDGLTKLHNHRFFQDQLTREIRRAARSSSPLSLLLVDIDDFKSLNDRFGHAAGDELLHGLALIMNSAVRSSDLLARYGGEEFAVLAPGTNLEGAYQLAEKLRTAIAESSFILGDSMRLTRVTVSVGVSQFKGDRKKFFDDADRALYRAKADGKNCVIVDDGRESA